MRLLKLAWLGPAVWDQRTPTGRGLSRAGQDEGSAAAAPAAAPPAAAKLPVLDEAEMVRRRRMHGSIVALKTRGAVVGEELYAEDARVVSEFGDPLARGRSNAAKVAGSLASAARPSGTVSKGDAWAEQAWSTGVGLSGLTRVEFDSTGLVSTAMLGNVTLRGASAAAASPARELLVRLVGGRYDQLADFVSTRLAGALPGPSLDGGELVFGPSDTPDPDAVGERGFVAYDALRSALHALNESLSKGVDVDPRTLESIFAPGFRVVGLAGETTAIGDLETLVDAVNALRNGRAALLAAGALRDETASARVYGLDRLSADVNVEFKARVGPRFFKVSADLDVLLEPRDRTYLCTLATLRALRVDDRDLEPSAAQKRLALLVSDILPRPSLARSGLGPRSSERDAKAPTEKKPRETLNDRDASALLALAAALHDEFPAPALSETGAVAALLAPDLTVKGLLGERLLDGRPAALAALRSATTLARLAARAGARPDISLLAVRVTADARLAADLRVQPSDLRITCLFTVQDAAVAQLQVADLSVAGASVLPARLAAVLRSSVFGPAGGGGIVSPPSVI